MNTNLYWLCPHCGMVDHVTNTKFREQENHIIVTKECSCCGKEWETVYSYDHEKTIKNLMKKPI